MTLLEWIISRPLSRKLIERVLDNQHFVFLPQTWAEYYGAKSKDNVVFKRMHKSVFDRVIDLQTFFTIVTGNKPKELHVGYREIGEIKKESIDVPIYSAPSGGMVGTLIEMPVFQENKSHHMEIK
jgi:hypothetical protein